MMQNEIQDNPLNMKSQQRSYSINMIVICILFFILIWAFYKGLSRTNKSIVHKQKLQKDQLQSFIEMQQSFIISKTNIVMLYLIYKQTLYFKTKMYQGTNLKSIFAVLKKQNLSQNSQNNQNNQNVSQNIRNDQNQNSITAFSFQDLVINKIKDLFEQKCKYVLQNMKKTIQIIKQSSLVIKNNKYMTRMDLFKGINLSDCFKYSIEYKQKVIQLNQKLIKLQLDLFILCQKQLLSDFESMFQLFKESIILCEQFMKFTETITNDLLLIKNKSDYNNKDINKSLIVEKILKDLFNYQQLSQQYLTNSKELNQLRLTFEKIKHSGHEQLIETVTQKLNKNVKVQDATNNQIEIQIRRIQNQLDGIQQFKQKLIKHKNYVSLQFQSLNQQSIRNNNENHLQFNPNSSHSTINVFQIRQNQNISQTTEIKDNQKEKLRESQQQTVQNFDQSKKLQFIKKLDKLMIVNRIKRQNQEYQRKSKQQQQNNILQHNQNHLQQESNVILESI